MSEVTVTISVCLLLLVTSIFFFWSNINCEENTNNGTVNLVLRKEWHAKAPKTALTRLSSPVSFVIISYTATKNCFSKKSCSVLIKHIQDDHFFSRKWFDIGFNFLVGGNGAAYKGRGWQFEGTHAYHYKSTSIGIAFIGTPSSVNKRQIEACKSLIKIGVKLGYINPNYKILIQKQVYAIKTLKLTKTVNSYVDSIYDYFYKLI